MHRNRPFTRWFLILALALLGGCGFQLRGTAHMPFDSIYLDMADTTSLYAELSRYIRANGATVVHQKEDAEVVLHVMEDRRDKKVLTLNTDGRVREHALYLYYRTNLQDSKGHVLQSLPEIVLKRSITYNENQELAKAAEEQLVYREMQTDLVQRLLRLLSSSHPKQADAQPLIRE